MRPPILSLACAALLSTDAGAASIYRNDEFALIVETQAYKIPRIRKVLDEMGLKPGMTVLDVGAGTGQQTRAMARAVGPSGRVYASDIDPALLKHIEETAKKDGLSNVSTLLVSGAGVDPAYAGRLYDRILIYEVYNYLTERGKYFAGLRGLLKPGGRLVLVEADQGGERYFYPEDVADWKGLEDAILAEPGSSPYRRFLSAALEETLRDGTASPEARRRMTLFHLNRALYSRLCFALFDSLEDSPLAPFDRMEKPYALWLRNRLKLGGAVDSEPYQMEVQMSGLRAALNKMLLIARYRRHFRFAGEIHPYWSSSPETAWALAHAPRSTEFEGAGFHLERKIALPPFQAVWIYAPAAPQSK